MIKKIIVSILITGLLSGFLYYNNFRTTFLEDMIRFQPQIEITDVAYCVSRKENMNFYFCSLMMKLIR